MKAFWRPVCLLSNQYSPIVIWEDFKVVFGQRYFMDHIYAFMFPIMYEPLLWFMLFAQNLLTVIKAQHKKYSKCDLTFPQAHQISFISKSAAYVLKESP